MKKTYLLLVAVALTTLVLSCSKDSVTDFEKEESMLPLTKSLKNDSTMALDTISGWQYFHLYQYKLVDGAICYVNCYPDGEKNLSFTEPHNYYRDLYSTANQFIHLDDDFATIFEWVNEDKIYEKYYVDYSYDEETGKFVLGYPFEMFGLHKSDEKPFVAQVIKLKEIEQDEYASNILVLDVDFPIFSFHESEATHSRVLLRASKLIYDDSCFEEFDYRTAKD